MSLTGVTLSGDMTYKEVVRALQRMNNLRLDESQSGAQGNVKLIHVREASIRESVGELFESKKIRQQRAMKVAQALETVISKTGQPQLLQNIYDRIASKGGFSGKDLALDFAPVNAGKPAKALQGGQVAPKNKGNSVRILGVPANSVKAEKLILRSSSAAYLISADKSPDSERLKTSESPYVKWINTSRLAVDARNSANSPKFFELQLKGTPTKDVITFADDYHQLLSADAMYHELKQAIGDASGAVIIEPRPDKFISTPSSPSVPTYSEEGLAAQIRASREKVSEAKLAGRNLVIYFATADLELQNALRKVQKKLNTAAKVIASAM